MMALDFTNELAPLIWTMEGLMLVAVVWLVGMFFTEQMRPTSFRLPERITGSAPHPTGPDLPHEPTSDVDRRMAA